MSLLTDAKAAMDAAALAHSRALLDYHLWRRLHDQLNTERIYATGADLEAKTEAYRQAKDNFQEAHHTLRAADTAHFEAVLAVVEQAPLEPTEFDDSLTP